MKVWIFILFSQVLTQLIPKKDGQLDLLAKRGKNKANKNSNKKSNKKDKNKKQTYNAYAVRPPKIPFAPEPVYNYPKPAPPKNVTIPPPKPSRQLGVSYKVKNRENSFISVLAL